MAQIAAWWLWLRGGATAAVVAWWPWLLACVAILAVLYGAWWLWWRLPKRQVDRLYIPISDAKARADVEDNFRKTITQLFAGLVTLFAGIAALAAAGVAYLNLSQQQKSSHDLLISNQVSKGFEQLGGAAPVIRLGGIYALEGVMNTSEEYHQPVLEALSAFVRDGTRNVTGDGPPATDIQAALTVIGRRAAIGKGVPDLIGAHIPKADLNGANLSHALLSNATLSGGNLSSADLSSAKAMGANLSGVFLVRANLSDTYLAMANLSGAAITMGANLSGAVLGDANLSHANLFEANLSHAFLVEANLSFANLANADLSGAYLSYADLRGIGNNLSQAQLDKACGTDAKLDPGLTIRPCPGMPSLRSYRP